ncbi:MAG: glutathione S-transferase [Pseudomonadota bacterium]
MGYTLYYWPIPFRGEFVRAVLALADQGCQEPGFDEVSALKLIAPDAQPVPFMGPPVLVDHEVDLSLAQLPAILRYLAEKHHLMPQAAKDVALTDKIVADANDVLDELTLFGGRSMWTLGEWESFAEERLPRWMAIFEQTMRSQDVTADRGYLFRRDTPGLGDVTVAILWGVMTGKLEGLRPLLDKHAPRVAGFVDRVLALPELSQQREKSDARFGDQYCGGQIEASIREMLARHGV